MADTSDRSDEPVPSPQKGDLTKKERVQWHLNRALESAESTDTKVHLRQALAECQDLPPTPLVECPLCGKVGLPERIQDHTCSTSNKRST